MSQSANQWRQKFEAARAAHTQAPMRQVLAQSDDLASRHKPAQASLSADRWGWCSQDSERVRAYDPDHDIDRYIRYGATAHRQLGGVWTEGMKLLVGPNAGEIVYVTPADLEPIIRIVP